MLNKLVKFAIFSSILCFNGVAIADTIELSTSDWPPYTIPDPEDGRHGFDYEVVSAAFTAVGDEAVIRFYPWSRALKLVENKQVDGVITCAYKPDREPFIIFSDPISGDHRTAVTSSSYSGPAPQTITDLKDFKRVIGVRKFISTDRLVERDIKHRTVPSVGIALKQVANGRADAAYFSNVNARYMGNNLGLSDKLKFHLLDPQEYEEFHICFSRNKPGTEDKVKRFNKGLKIIRADGTYEEIHNRYR